MSKSIKVNFDMDALQKVTQEAFEEKALSGDLSYDCPDCGKPIPITGLHNVCSCGFNLEVLLDEVHL